MNVVFDSWYTLSLLFQDGISNFINRKHIPDKNKMSQARKWMRWDDKESSDRVAVQINTEMEMCTFRFWSNNCTQCVEVSVQLDNALLKDEDKYLQILRKTNAIVSYFCCIVIFIQCIAFASIVIELQRVAQFHGKEITWDTTACLELFLTIQLDTMEVEYVCWICT